MIRFVHSADWQLGARFVQFGARGRVLREARLATLARALELARQRQADAFVVAGDLFEDNQVEDALVEAVVDLFAASPSLPVFLLPGNHDPHSGPDCVWRRRAFARAPAHVRVLTQAEAIDLGGAWLLAAPLHQKNSSIDPSLRLDALAAALPAEAIRIGFTHGALAIPGMHQPNDFPIALTAATRAGLDYLGVGHWHNWLADTDGGRIVMPGTPEPDQFDQERGGRVALVEIDARGAPPRVEAVPVAGLSWRRFDFDLLAAEAARTALEAELRALDAAPQRAVVRVVLTGCASPALLAATRDWLEPRLAAFLVGQIQDRSLLTLGEAERADLQSRHPLLGRVLSDLDRLEALATGAAGTTAAEPLPLAQAQAWLAPGRIALTDLTAAHFQQARLQVLHALAEESR